MLHNIIQLAPISVTYQEKEFEGSSVISNFTFANKNIELSYFKGGEDVGMAARFNVSVDDFDTEAGLKMRA